MGAPAAAAACHARVGSHPALCPPLNLSEPSSPHLANRDNAAPYFTASSSGEGVIRAERVAQARSRHSVTCSGHVVAST